MSASLRFLVLAVAGWAGIRAATLGTFPGMEGFSLTRGKALAAQTPPAKATAIVPTEFPAVAPPMLAAAEPAGAIPTAPAMFHYAAAPAPFYYYPVAAPSRAPIHRAALPRAPRQLNQILPDPEPLFYSPIPQLDEWPLSRLASTSLPPRRSATGMPQQSTPQFVAEARLDRLQLTAWALLRGRQGVFVRQDDGLATGGMLGGSQAGARLSWNLSRQLALTLRSSSTVGARGGEVAGGVKFTPFRSIPVALTAERRQRIGALGGGRTAFALFAEGGVWQRPIAWGFDLDAYVQAGVVGARRRDLFVDGAFTLTRPIYGPLSGGFGFWGGAQPGLYRVDAGPRLSYRVRPNIRVHLDWRQRLAGNAEPGSGPAVTLAADF